MAMPKSLYLNVCRDKERRVWGVARLCLSDGSCLVIESRIYRDLDVKGRDHAAGDEEPAKNKALDEALDKLCVLAKKPGIKQAIPLPARVALMAVCKARNLQKIKKAIDLEPEEYDEEDEEEVGAEWRDLKHSDNPIYQRALGALRLWR